MGKLFGRVNVVVVIIIMRSFTANIDNETYLMVVKKNDKMIG